VHSLPATVRPPDGPSENSPSAVRTALLTALVRAGFRRFSTYRQATAAALFTNSVFGFLRCFVLLAAIGTSAAGTIGGYDRGQLATYCWTSQGLIGVVMLWGWTDLGDRIRTGEVVIDLLRPVHPVAAFLAVDLGRAGYAVLTRFAGPVLIGAIFFPLYAPRWLPTYPLFAVSVLLGVLVSFGCRYLVNAVAYWLLDVRGVNVFWTFATTALSGLAFPLHFLPSWLTWMLWLGTPFPSVLQAPLDVLTERASTASRLGLIAMQAIWAAVVLAAAVGVQRRAERRLVIQGG
jgi:viologen exporter family transport system permease protein